MTDKQSCSSKHENTDYILGNFEDETPATLSEENVNDQQIPDITPNEPASTDTCSQADKENLEKFEKHVINKILAIRVEVDKIKTEISTSEKEVVERDFKKFEETLILKILSLDNIQTKGIASIKETRKNAITFVQDCLKLLDSKIK